MARQMWERGVISFTEAGFGNKKEAKCVKYFEIGSFFCAISMLLLRLIKHSIK